MSTLAPQPVVPAPQPIRGIVGLAIFGLFILTSVPSVIILSVLVLTGGSPGAHDFISYWAAGTQLVHGANPYGARAILVLEKSAGFLAKYNVLLMRNPPSGLFLAAPLGMASARVGSILWSLLILGCLAWSIHMLWRMHGSRRNPLHLIGYVFAPTLACFAAGQTAIFVLLGLVLFLRFHETKPWLAGAALSLCMLKPHLFLPFAAVMVGWIVSRRTYRVLGGALLAFGACCAFPLFLDSSVWRQYVAMARTSGIENEFMPVLGVMLRFAIDRHAMWLQFLPAALACLWAVWYFRRNREDWDWVTHGSLVMLVSVLVAPYSWITDQVVLLPAVLQGIYAGRDKSLVVLLALISSVEVQTPFTHSMHSALYAWPAIAWFAWYIWSLWPSRKSSASPGDVTAHESEPQHELQPEGWLET